MKKRLSFSLRTVTEEKVKKVMEKIKKKKSSTLEGIGQNFLLLGAEVVTIPLTRLAKTSIQKGVEYFQRNGKSSGNPHTKKGETKETTQTTDK